MIYAIHVGFTGTRHGMTCQQFLAVGSLVEVLINLKHIYGHHGDCVGADAEFHTIAKGGGADIVLHPPIDETHRAWCKGVDEFRPALTHLARNRAIVQEADVMIATPFEPEWQPRGGTWYTIDRAKRTGKPLAIVLPVGIIEFHGAPWPA